MYSGSLSDRLLKKRPSFFIAFFMVILCFLGGCQEDLAPSDSDERSVTTTSTQSFSVQDTQGNVLELDALLDNHDAVVLYFTMWCPTCDSHMSLITREFMPEFTRVAFISVDYVSATSQQALRAQIENGYQGMTVVQDEGKQLTRQFNGTMATTVVIGQEKSILLNEDFKNGARLREVLEELPIE
ncbi:MAG: redoxin domain-containing protein [Hahellaceae bacterium]|nr:redoxin domain-containing protein [Hahellaceae bacterium]